MVGLGSAVTRSTQVVLSLKPEKNCSLGEKLVDVKLVIISNSNIRFRGEKKLVTKVCACEICPKATLHFQYFAHDFPSLRPVLHSEVQPWSVCSRKGGNRAPNVVCVQKRRLSPASGSK